MVERASGFSWEQQNARAEQVARQTAKENQQRPWDTANKVTTIGGQVYTWGERIKKYADGADERAEKKLLKTEKKEFEATKARVADRQSEMEAEKVRLGEIKASEPAETVTEPVAEVSDSASVEGVSSSLLTDGSTEAVATLENTTNVVDATATGLDAGLQSADTALDVTTTVV